VIAVGKDRQDLQTRADDTSKWFPPTATAERPTVLGAWKSSVVTAEVLRTKQFPAPQIILPGLICEGVTILASKPKVGKSWLALDVCIATAANRFTLGSLKPKTGDVLYLALEDSQRRLQRRVDRILSAVSEAWPARLTMATEWRRVDEGGLDDIREWCDGVTEPKLIVIDTLAKIRPAKGSNKAAYDVDYDVIAGLHKIANGRGIAILIIHHTRKMEADDAFDTVSGTLGLTGAADTILVLDKRAGAVTLHARGRDIEESETALEFNKETCRWTILGAAGEVHRSNERSRIIQALTGASEGLGVKDIMALGEFSSRGAVDVLLCKMAKAGEIERSSRGFYRLPSSQSSDAGKIGEKERLPSQGADLIAENSNLTNLINLTGELGCKPATIGRQKRPPRFKDAEVDDAREL
jgi:AAA domain